MKKILTGLTISFLMFIGISKVMAASNPYKEISSFGPNCTWYAWKQAYEKAGVILPGWGNANTWLDYAKKAGYETGVTPRPKSIAVWKWDQYGHVGYVEKVSNDKIYVLDSASYCIDTEDPELKACLEKSVCEETDNECHKKYAKRIACEMNATYWEEPGDLIGYIYLDNIPKTTTTTPTKKSSNANLTKLEISSITFTFQKDTLAYELAVDNDVESITINATAEDKKASIDGNKEYQLNVGINKINVVVTAEDKTKKTYTLEITRKDNDAYLKNVTISEIDFTFDKNTFAYEMNTTLSKISIKGESKSDLATIEGLGNYELQDGMNTITIKVTTEDQKENTYTFKINKQVQSEEIAPKKDSYFIYFILGGAAFLIGIIILFKKIVRKGKKHE